MDLVLVLKVGELSLQLCLIKRGGIILQVGK